MGHDLAEFVRIEPSSEKPVLLRHVAAPSRALAHERAFGVSAVVFPQPATPLAK